MAPSAKRGNASKRKRAEIADKTGPETGRSTDLWFEDGNIVLDVKGLQFRVHRGVLGTQSTFFQDMLNIPQPASQDLVDGCPVVSMEDAPEDWRNLLTAIYLPHTLHSAYQNLPFNVVASMLRLGDKYQFEAMRDDALRRLKLELPTTDGLLPWLSIFSPFWSKNFQWMRTTKNHPGGWPLDNEFDIVNLAVELGIQSILPIIYYLCLITRSTTEIFDGYTRPDGTVVQLSQQSRHILILGQERIRAATWQHTLAWITSRPCSNSAESQKSQLSCQQRRLELVENMVKAVSQPGGIRYALDTFDQDSVVGLCASCQSVARTKHEQGRQALWSNLPSYFGLLPWKDLKDFVHFATFYIRIIVTELQT